MKVKVGHSIFNSDPGSLVFSREAGILDITSIPLPPTLEAGLECIRYLTENEIDFCFSSPVLRRALLRPDDELFRTGLSREEIGTLIAAGGKYCKGRDAAGELDGMIYWPAEYMFPPDDAPPADAEYPRLPRAGDLEEARKFYCERLKVYFERERNFAPGVIRNTGGSMLIHHVLDAGAEIPSLEMMPGDPERLCAALRGAARSRKKESYGLLIAFGWYGGGLWDEVYFARWINALHYSFLTGAASVLSESGQLGFSGYGNNITRTSPEAERFRSILRAHREFCNTHELPEGGPECKVAFMLGNLDGCPGVWSGGTVWGQYDNPEFRAGDAEKSWDLLDDLYRKMPWFDNLNTGTEECSGQVPYGTYDIVPADTAIEELSRYGLLCFLGWNTMTDGIYNTLVQYVRQGGHLILALPHLDSSIRRDGLYRPFRDGQWQELLGVEFRGFEDVPVTGMKFTGKARTEKYVFPYWGTVCDPKFIGHGFPAGILSGTFNTIACGAKTFDSAKEKMPPVLTEHQIGKGSVFLLNSGVFPGNDDIRRFMALVLQTAMKGEMPDDLRINSSETVRYALFGSDLYAMNSDPELPAFLRVNGKLHQLAPLELRKIEK